MSEGIPIPKQVTAGSMTARFRLIAVLFMIAAAGLVLYGTAYDTGISPDSTVYLSVARNLVQGNGWTDDSSGTASPLTRGGPMFPLLLAGLERIGLPGTHGARLLNAVSFAVLMMVFLLLARRISSDPAMLACCAAIVLLSEPLAYLHVRVLTEPAYFAFAFSSMALTMASTEISSDRRRRTCLLIAALLASCAALTRYAGVSLVAAAVVSLIFSRRRLLARLFDAAVFATIGLAPLAAWFVRNALIGGKATGNPVTLHLLSASHLYSARTTIATWLHLFLDWYVLLRIPVNWKLNTAVLFITAIAVIPLLSWKEQRRNGRISTATLVLLYALAYFGTVCMAISVIDFSTPLDFRILAPSYPLLVLLGAHAAIVVSRRSQAVRLLLIACAVVFIVISGTETLLLLADTHRNGSDFNGRPWKESMLIAALKELPRSVPVVTNGDDAYAVNVGRIAVALPPPVDTVSSLPRNDYEPRMKQLGELFAGGAVLAEFSAVGYRTYLPSETLLKERFDLCRAAVFPDGALLRKCRRPVPASPASAAPAR
jgi:hypothetical protein